MAYLTANGFAASEGVLTIPRLGRAVGEFLLSVPASDSPIAKGAAVALKFQDGTTYQMAAERVGAERGLVRVLLVGGAGGLSKVLKPKFYEDAPATTVAKDVFTEAGEEPGDLDLPGSLKAWVRREGSAYQALRALLLEYPKRAWRIQPDGKAWIGVETWPVGPEVRIIEARPARGSILLEASPSLMPALDVPAVGKVGRVVHQVGAQIQTEVYVDG